MRRVGLTKGIHGSAPTGEHKTEILAVHDAILEDITVALADSHGNGPAFEHAIRTTHIVRKVVADVRAGREHATRHLSVHSQPTSTREHRRTRVISRDAAADDLQNPSIELRVLGEINRASRRCGRVAGRGAVNGVSRYAAHCAVVERDNATDRLGSNDSDRAAAAVAHSHRRDAARVTGEVAAQHSAAAVLEEQPAAINPCAVASEFARVDIDVAVAQIHTAADIRATVLKATIADVRRRIDPADAATTEEQSDATDEAAGQSVAKH